jgi:hypothetical protein
LDCHRLHFWFGFYIDGKKALKVKKKFSKNSSKGIKVIKPEKKLKRFKNAKNICIDNATKTVEFPLVNE